MTKEKLQDAINAMQNGQSAGFYHDELGTLLALINRTDDSAILSAWLEISETSET